MTSIQELPPHMQLFARLRDDVRSGSQRPAIENPEVPVAFYLDEDWYAREMRELFAPSPMIVGHAAMVSEPGEHFAHDHLGKPLLIVRGHDREIRAFYNVCRHRGVRLAREEGVVRKPSFVCPYHHWTYDLDGSLKSVPLPETFEGVDLSCRGLREVRCEVRHGLIWVLPDESAELDLDAGLGTINADLDSFDTAGQVVFRQTVKSVKANWKLIIEAFEDGYHVTRLHQKTVGPMFMDAKAAIDRVGFNLRSVVARSDFPETLELPPKQWDDRLHVSFAYFIYPNNIFVIHPDYVSHLALYPQSIESTIVQHTCLIPSDPKTQAERDHWERAFDIIENGVFGAEDYFVCENAQIGLASGANETLLLGREEYGIAVFHEILREVMGPFEKA